MSKQQKLKLSLFTCNTIQVKGLVVLSDFNPWDCDNQSIQQYQEIIDQKNVDLVCSYSYNNNQTTKRQLQRQEFIDEFNRDNKLCIICNTPGIVKGLVFEDAMKLLLPPGVTTGNMIDFYDIRKVPLDKTKGVYMESKLLIFEVKRNVVQAKLAKN